MTVTESVTSNRDPAARVAQAIRKMIVRPTSRMCRAISFGLRAARLDQRDHAIEKRLARIGRDPHHDAVGEHFGAAGDGRSVAAALANDRCRFSGDRRLVDRRDALDDVAVAGDELAGFDDDRVAAPQL
jgi:hypothetical protein